MTDVYIAAGARTPMGAFQGSLSSLTSVDLGTTAIAAAVSRAGLAGADIDEVIMGCVLAAGLRQGPARQAAIAAGIPVTTGATTINKLCGSGMKATMLAHDLIKAGTNKIMVAGGMESMTNAPYILPKMRSGARLGHSQVIDHMFLDGLEDAYDKGRLMGTFAEDCAEKFQFTRQAQDEYALASLQGALDAQSSGAFDGEIAAVTLQTRKGEVTISQDEQPAKARPDKIPELKPAFRKDGTVTAANSSSISDGAAALVLASRTAAEARGLNIRARILGHASHAQAPGLFTTAPVPAAQKLLKAIGWKVEDVDL
jgi:acetyl-CoA C-acetyltransferase